ncbi:hypothetical protein CANINC_003826 [Pichia inconspicua]|uniref:Bud site selection protein 5 n=1 Tax=Pichia inconspicua TaxID=52247 RepID=A0A4V4NFD3_9ASCO|nr:hypothetical protein CANINC_003826 [[Candida] inconspicua]
MTDDITDNDIDLTHESDMEPGSKNTSPLHLNIHRASFIDTQVAVKNDKISNLDFSYLSSQISPKAAEWSPQKENKTIKLDQFVDDQGSHSRSSSISQYNKDQIDQVGVLDEEDLNDNELNNSTTFMNSSIPTQEFRDMRLSHSDDEREEYEEELIFNRSKENTFDDDATPIVSQQNQFSTPKVDDNTFNESMKLSPQVINQIFEEEPTSIANNRIQSTTSSIYSALPPNNNRIQSTTSSIYSELPRGSSLGITNGLKSFRIASFKPTLHKHLSQPIEEDEEEEEEENNYQTENVQSNTPSNIFKHRGSSFEVSKFESIAEDETLDFNQTKNTNSIQNSVMEDAKPRVSVLNQSIFQQHYDNLDTPSSEHFQEYIKRGTEIQSESSPNTETFDQFKEDNDVLRKQNEHLTNKEEEEDEEDASALFVTSIYAFNANTLESENDSSICLSFDQDEIAFTCNLDDSGWGEVTLLSSLKRGWVPMNYFRSTVVTGFTDKELKSMSAKELTDTRAPLRLLLRHAGTFLLNPQSKPVYIEGELRGYTFDVECFNGITDGLRKLLIDTDCISRSNSVVQTKPVIRKIRKKLLRGWADLINKGKDYMGTIATTKIEYLQLLTFHLLQKAITFLDIWGLEMERIKEEEAAKEAAIAAEFAAQEALARSESQRQLIAKPVQKSSTALRWNSDEAINLNILYLSRPPILSYRVNEIYEQLTTYLCLIAGRIDLVEHNPKSFSVVGTVVGHINLLVNEYFFIIRLLKSTMNEADAENKFNKNMVKYGKLVNNVNLKNQLKSLDVQTTKLRQLVEELNTYIRILHNSSKKDLFNRTENANNSTSEAQNNLYFYSREGGAVVVCACKMIELSSNAYYILRNTLNLNNESVLPMNRKYPNYIKMAISPNEFLKKCSATLVDSSGVQAQVNKFKRESRLPGNINNAKSNPNRASMRYSSFKIGNSTDVQLSTTGLDFLSNIKPESNSGSPFLSQDEFATDLQPNTVSDLDFNVEDELIRSTHDNKVIGASFKALVYLLTDEENPPDYFFVSTFLLTFRIFSDSAQLLEALIRRFDPDDLYKTQVEKNTQLTESVIRSRRKLIAKFFKFWLESYWNSKNDYVLLAPLINFFNEGMRRSLPIESSQLLVIISKLVGHPPIENTNDRLNFYNNFSNNQQLLTRKISSKLQKKTVSRMSLGANANTLLTEIEAYNAFLEDIETYELEKIDDRSEASKDSSRVSLTLSLNIELKNSNSNATLLTSQQLSMIKMVILSYRRMLGSHWHRKITESQFEPLDTRTLIDSWWKASQESWKILNDDLTLLNYNGLEIAKQLTLIESKLFCSIQVGELLNQNFTTKKLHLNLSPNIQKSILFTNLLSDYVIESILKPKLQMRQRIHAFKCWLKIGISCLYLRNFNSLASIMTSLQSFLISRIKPIWEGLSEKYKELFNYLASIIHPNKNYNTYRERLRDFLATNLQESMDIPSVPYLSLFLQDLTFIVDGNPNYRKNPKSFLDQKLINIDKYTKITQVISEIQTLQISYRDTGELGVLYNDRNTDLIRSETIKNLKNQLKESNDVSFDDMFDITGVPIMQELILLEIWKVKQTNARDDDRSWKLSCAIQPREYDN